MFYLIPVDARSFDSIEALTEAVAAADGTTRTPKIDPAAYLVVNGTAQRLVPKLELRPLDEKPATKRDKDAEVQERADVLKFVASAGKPLTVAEVAKGCGITNADVSRHKAALIKDGKLDAAAKKGTLQAKAAA